jgi:ketosteroid isomerase-like protein
MPDENIEIVRRGVASWSGGDLDAFLSMFDPECEVIFRPDVPEPGPFRGREELRRWAEGFRSAWQDQRTELVEAEAAGDDVFALVRVAGHGAGSGIDTDETFAFVFTFQEGLVTRWRSFVESDEAREAAGLPN